MILDDNGFFYRGLFQYNKNTKDYFHNPVLAVCLTYETEKLPLFVTVEMTAGKANRQCKCTSHSCYGTGVHDKEQTVVLFKKRRFFLAAFAVA